MRLSWPEQKSTRIRTPAVLPGFMEQGGADLVGTGGIDLPTDSSPANLRREA